MWAWLAMAVANPPRSSLRLRVWQTPDGVAWMWGGRRASAADPFFIFGRCGSGIRIFQRLGPKVDAEVAHCTARARERFSTDVDIIRGSPRRRKRVT